MTSQLKLTQNDKATLTRGMSGLSPGTTSTQYIMCFSQFFIYSAIFPRHASMRKRNRGKSNISIAIKILLNVNVN